MEGVYVKTEPEPIPHASTSEPPVPLAVPLEAQPCRLCANIPERAIEIYSTEGLSNQLSDRINEYLPVKVSPDDKLPLCCCWTCVTTLLSFHELVVACVEAEKRLQVVLTEPKPIPIPVPIPAVPDPEPEIPEYNDDDAEMMDADDGEGDDDYEPENDDEDEESEEETKPIPGTSDDTEFTETQITFPDEEIYEEVVTYSNEIQPSESVSAEKPDVGIKLEIIDITHAQASSSSTSPKVPPKKRTIDDLFEDKLSCVEIYTAPPLPEEPKFKCEPCDCSFQTKELLKMHMEMHSGDNIYVCHVCSRGYKTKEALDEHQEIHDKVWIFRCKICNQTFNRQFLLNVHLDTHKETRPYTCDCGRRFKYESSLLEHQKDHSTETKVKESIVQNVHILRTYTCTVCGTRFKHRRNYKQHVAVHKNPGTLYYCNLCEFRFSRQNQLIDHKKLNHPNDVGDNHDLVHSDFRQLKQPRSQN